LTLGTQ